MATTPPSTCDSAVGTRAEHCQRVLQRADAVCFDVDSTVVTSEGIDALADYLGCGDAVAALTKAAMEGGRPFHTALDLSPRTTPFLQKCRREIPSIRQIL